MPAAQLHYPFEHQEEFERRFPADFICEAIDQTRGWFYSLLAVNTLVFDHSPYRNVVCLAHIVDRDGQKMSKSRGNVIDPWTILESRGADALRWYFFSAGSPWTNRRIDEQTIDESTRRFLFTLWSTHYFFSTYADLDGWTVGDTVTAPGHPPSHVLDRWTRSRLHSTVGEVTDALESFDVLGAAQSLERFVDDLSNWYVRRSRARFWKSADPAAHATLHECLVTVALLLAPLCPFVADELYRNLTGGESVHLADWPDADTDAVDTTLEAEMALARQVVGLGRAARTESRLKIRQPLRRALVVLPDHMTLSSAVMAEVADELNVKALESVADLEGLLDETVVPNFRRLGPKVGPLMPAVKAALAALDGATVRRALETDGSYRIDLGTGTGTGTGTVTLGPEDVEVHASAHEEFALARDGAYAVALDTAIDDDLRLEGLARELVRALNDLRKARDLALSDRISVGLHATGALAEAARRHAEWIKGEVLALEWSVETVDVETVDGESDAGADDPAFSTIEIDGVSAAVRLVVVEGR